MSIIWLLIAILLLIVEFMTVNITYIWFSLSAFITMIVSFYSDRYLVLLICFFLDGSLSCLFLRDRTFLYFKAKTANGETDKIIGKEAIVTKEIKKNSYGEVKVLKKKWAAYSNDHLKVNESSIVEKIEGVKLKVRKK